LSKSPKQEERTKKPRRKLTAAERKEIRKIMEKARGDGKPHSAQDMGISKIRTIPNTGSLRKKLPVPFAGYSA